MKNIKKYKLVNPKRFIAFITMIIFVVIYLLSILHIKTTIEDLNAQIIEEQVKILGYIKTIDDSLMRQIIYHRCVLRMKWGQVARHIPGDNSPDGLRKMLDRFLEEK